MVIKIGAFLVKKFSIIVLLTVLGLVIFALGIQMYTSQYIYHDKDELPSKYRVAVVYGAKLDKKGQPGIYLKDRLDAVLDLYFSEKIDMIILSGERLDQGFNEIDAMEKYVLEAGVPIEKTYLDTGGLDTYSTVYRIKNIFKFDEVIYISQNFHLTRATFLGKMMGVDCIGYNADRSKYKNLSNHKFREVFANIKAMLDITKKRQPEVLVDSKDSIN